MSNPVDIPPEEQILVKGSGYTYQFSRGLLAHSLEPRGLPLDQAYRVARRVHKVLQAENKKEISENDLREYVREVAFKIAGADLAYQYNLIEKWHESSIPLVILIAGAKGTGNSLIGELIAKRMVLPQIVSTNIVNQILRKTISPSLAPALHAQSYLAYKAIRPMYSVLYDKVLIGFEQHARFVTEAVEALVRRALNEGLSMVVRGEHLVPRYMSEELTKNPNVIYVVLDVKDEEEHQKRYMSLYDEKKQIVKLEYFSNIRKIHDYLVEEARNRNQIIIDANDVVNATNNIYKIVLDRLATLFPDSSDGNEVVFRGFDDSVIDS